MSSNFGHCLSPRGSCVPLGQIPVSSYSGPPNATSGIKSLDLNQRDIINALPGGRVPITETGKLALASTGVVAGTYATPANLVVDAKGRITSIQNGGGSSGVQRVGNTADSQIAVWDGANQNRIRAAPVTVSATGVISGVSNLTATGTVQAANVRATAAFRFDPGAAAGLFLQSTDALGNAAWAAVSGTVPDGTVEGQVLQWDNVGLAWTPQTNPVFPNNITVTTQILAADGAAGAPGYAFSTLATTGVFRTAGGDVAVSVTGTSITETTSAPSFRPTGDGTTSLGDATHRWSDIFLTGASLNMKNAAALNAAVYGQTAAGDATLTIGAITAWIASAAGTLNVAQGITADQGNVSAANGDVVANAAVIAGSTVTAGTGLTVTSGVTSLPAGALGAPALFLAGDTTTGLYRPALNELAVTVAGTQRGLWSATGLTVTGTLSATVALDAPTFTAGDGAVGSAAFGFTGATNTGMYRTGGNVAWTVAGTNRATLSATGLSVVNGVTAGAGLTVTTGLTSLPAGAVGAPSVFLGGDTTTGLYRPAANQLAVTVSSTQRALFSSTGLAVTGALSATTTSSATTAFRAPDGSNTVPGYGFTGATNTGMYRDTGNIAWTVAGTNRATLSATGLSVVNALTAGTGLTVTSGVATFPAGSAAAPALVFAGSPTTGIFQPGAADQLSIGTAGAQRMRFAANTIIMSAQFLQSDGAAAAPTYAFVTPGNTGMYRDSGTGAIGWSIAGTQRASLSATGLTVTNDLIANNLKTTTIYSQLLAASVSTTSATFVDFLTGTSHTFVGRPTLFLLTTFCFSSVAQTAVAFAIRLGAGADNVIAQMHISPATSYTTVSGSVVFTPSSGSQTVTIRWRRPYGTGALNSVLNETYVTLSIVEM